MPTDAMAALGQGVAAQRGGGVALRESSSPNFSGGWGVYVEEGVLRRSYRLTHDYASVPASHGWTTAHSLDDAAELCGAALYPDRKSVV